MNTNSKIAAAVADFFDSAENGVVWVTPGTENHSSNFYGDDHIIALEADEVVGCITTAYDNWESEDFYDGNGDAISDEDKLDLCIELVLDDLQYDKPDDQDGQADDDEQAEPLDMTTIASTAIADYLTADYGCWLAVWDSGYWELRRPGETLPPACIAAVKCPGIGNLDSTVFSDGWVTRQDDGSYIVTDKHHDDQGRIIPDLDHMIRECCRDGDVSDFVDQLAAALTESAAE